MNPTQCIRATICECPVHILSRSHDSQGRSADENRGPIYFEGREEAADPRRPYGRGEREVLSRLVGAGQESAYGGMRGMAW
jgi:hypothetical protein